MSSPSDPSGGYGAARPAGYGAYPPGGYGTTTPPSYGGSTAAAYPPGSYRPAPAGPGAHPVETADAAPPSLGDLISKITTDLSTLMRQEVELAKAEATQSAKRAGKGAGMFGGAGFAGYFVVLFWSIALWWAIGDGMGHGWSALIVAVLWAIVAAVLALMGRKQLAAVRGLDRTSETLGKIPNAVKGNEEQNR